MLLMMKSKTIDQIIAKMGMETFVAGNAFNKASFKS